MAVDFACECERWKQLNLVENVIGRTNQSTCLFEDVTKLVDDEERKCVRHCKACDHWLCWFSFVFAINYGHCHCYCSNSNCRYAIVTNGANGFIWVIWRRLLLVKLISNR